MEAYNRYIIPVLILSIFGLGSGCHAMKQQPEQKSTQTMDPASINAPTKAPLAPVSWTYKAEKSDRKPNAVHIIFTAVIQPRWHMYSTEYIAEGPIATSFKFENEEQLDVLPINELTKPIKKKDENFNVFVKFFENKAVFETTVQAKVPMDKLIANIEYMACNDKMCLPPKEIRFEIPIVYSAK